jgi:hypothetical protein
MKGSQESLTTVVLKDAANWLTPATVQIQRTDMQKRIDYRASIGRKYVPGSLEEQMQHHGQAAPANHSTDGSRQGWWTPQVQDSKHSRTNPTANGKRDLLVNQVNWATPRSGKTTDENAETWALRQEKGDVATMPLTAQVKCWGTPTARDHKSGRGNEEREYKELTPMVERTQTGKLNPRWVETLMGLPVGWVMPSCKSPVTIEQTNCDSSATESCPPLLNSPLELCLPNSQATPTQPERAE